VGEYRDLPSYIRKYAVGHSFVDIGCMWSVNGLYSFLAEEVGATSVKGVDVFGPTGEFLKEHEARSSSVDFILGDITSPTTIEAVGTVDIVFCSGVLYHHPSPFDLIVALRQICSETLILRTATIPEVGGLKNMAVYYPMLSPSQRAIWELSSLHVGHQVGLTSEFKPEQGYGNWFWGMTPSCVESLLETGGFKVISRVAEPAAHTFVCEATATPFRHRLPDEALESPTPRT
jgi:SAM-dependent methyltransferase